jgi:hypothetical protein
VWPYSIALSGGDTITFKDSSGPGELEQYYLGNLDNVEFKSDKTYQISKSVNKKKVSLSDEIEVTIHITKPEFKRVQVTDTVPSGFTIVQPRYAMNSKQIKFYAGDGSDLSFTYILKAKQTGTYRFEPAILTAGKGLYYKTTEMGLQVE